MVHSHEDYHSPPRIFSGTDILDNIVDELRYVGVANPLLISDITQPGAVEAVSFFSHSNMKTGAIFDDAAGYPTLIKVEKFSDIFIKKGCDSIISIGGGSVMDIAKGVNVLVSQGGGDLLTYAGKSRLDAPMLPFVFIPLTSPMVTDISGEALIHDMEKNITINLSSPLMIPDTVVLSQEMLSRQVSPDITAFGGIAALAAAVDAYLCAPENALGSSMLKSLAFKIISLVRGSVLMPGKEIYKRGQVQYDQAAMDDLARAGIMAGSLKCTGGLVTALARSARFVSGVSLDVAMAVLLPFVLENRLNFCEQKIARLFLPMAGETVYKRTPENKRGKQMLHHVVQLMKALKDLFEIPLSLKLIRVSKDELGPIAEMALEDFGGPMSPGRDSLKDIEKILTRAFV